MVLPAPCPASLPSVSLLRSALGGRLHVLLVGCLGDGVLLADCLAAPGGLHAHPSLSLPQLHASLLHLSCWWCVPAAVDDINVDAPEGQTYAEWEASNVGSGAKLTRRAVGRAWLLACVVPSGSGRDGLPRSRHRQQGRHALPCSSIASMSSAPWPLSLLRTRI